MNWYVGFVIFTIVAFEIPKAPYILKSLSTGIYYPFPQYNDKLNLPASESDPRWVIIHWFVGILTILCTILAMSFPKNKSLDFCYRWSNLLFSIVLIPNLFVLGGLNMFLAMTINILFGLDAFLTWLRWSNNRNETSRMVSFVSLSIVPVILNNSVFIAYCMDTDWVWLWVYPLLVLIFNFSSLM